MRGLKLEIRIKVKLSWVGWVGRVKVLEIGWVGNWSWIKID